MLKWFRKRRALRSYKTKLARGLRALYGAERHYSPAQVRRVVVERGLSIDFVCFAYAIYCDREAFEAHHREANEVCDYDAMVAQLGHGCVGAELVAVDHGSVDHADHSNDSGWADLGDFDAGCSDD